MQTCRQPVLSAGHCKECHLQNLQELIQTRSRIEIFAVGVSNSLCIPPMRTEKGVKANSASRQDSFLTFLVSRVGDTKKASALYPLTSMSTSDSIRAVAGPCEPTTQGVNARDV